MLTTYIRKARPRRNYPAFGVAQSGTARPPERPPMAPDMPALHCVTAGCGATARAGTKHCEAHQPEANAHAPAPIPPEVEPPDMRVVTGIDTGAITKDTP